MEILEELLSIQEEITLSIDRLSLNGLNILNNVSHDISHRTGQNIGEAKAENYEVCMNEIYYLYRKSEFIITEIHCDN